MRLRLRNLLRPHPLSEGEGDVRKRKEVMGGGKASKKEGYSQSAKL